jgi:Mrp family chromosome partitioning ATPase
MEKIKQALERAREQREFALGTTAVAASAETTSAPQVAATVPTVERAVDQVVADTAAVAAALAAASAASHARRTRVVAVDAQLLRRNRILRPQSTGPEVRAYKMLRTQVLQRMGERGFRSLAVVSPGEGDGKSLTAANLAIAIGEDADHTSLLVDLDLHHPAIASLFGTRVETGVDRCLRGEASVADALVAPQGYGGFVLLPAARPVPQSSELLASERAAAVLAEIQGRYVNRIVVYDLPPLLVADDALALLPRVDAALLVVHEGHTRRAEVERALDLLRKVPVVGTVLNGSREKRLLGD